MASPSGGGRSSQSRGAFTQLCTGFKGRMCVSFSSTLLLALPRVEKKEWQLLAHQGWTGSRVYVCAEVVRPPTWLFTYWNVCFPKKHRHRWRFSHIPLILPTRAAQLRNNVVVRVSVEHPLAGPFHWFAVQRGRILYFHTLCSLQLTSVMKSNKNLNLSRLAQAYDMICDVVVHGTSHKRLWVLADLNSGMFDKLGFTTDCCRLK